MKKILKTLGVLLAAFAVVYSFYFMWKQSQPAPEVFELVQPAKRDIVNQVVATGTIEARVEVELKPKVTGVIETLRVKAGDVIHIGDEIATIRVIPDMAMLNEAQNRVETARISLEQIERDAKRSQALFEGGVVSKAENEQVQNSLSQAREALVAARSQVEVITKGVSKRSGTANTTVVLSTMDGIILNVPVKVGSTVSGSSQFSEGTTIAKVGDLNDVIFKGDIDEMQVASLQLGMPVTLAPGAMKDVTIPAELEYISPEGVMSNGSRKFEIKAAARIPDGVKVRSGYSVNATIEIAKVSNALSVDEACVVFEDGKPYVYKLTSDKNDTENQQWERVPVTLGISDGLYVEIKRGVTADMILRGTKN